MMLPIHQLKRQHWSPDNHSLLHKRHLWDWCIWCMVHVLLKLYSLKLLIHEQRCQYFCVVLRTWTASEQCCRFSGNITWFKFEKNFTASVLHCSGAAYFVIYISYVTRKIIHVWYKIASYLQDQSIQILFYIILKTKSLFGGLCLVDCAFSMAHQFMQRSEHLDPQAAVLLF